MKRYLVYPFDFDTRAELLTHPIQDDWEPDVKANWEENRRKIRRALKDELGERDFDQKVQNFADVGSAPFSIVSYHNEYYHQTRYAFYYGFYYPALVSACALGERMLNHMVLDLRESFVGTEPYKRVYRKSSFDNWDVPIEALDAWGVFQNASVAEEFKKLKTLRNKSLHFNLETYENVRDDALSALKALANIVTYQFGFQGPTKWLIEGTRGHCFIKKDAETDPFMMKYYIPQCPYVSALFSINFASQGVLFFDHANVEDTQVSDEEFARMFNERNPEELAPSDLPPGPDVTCVLRPYSATKPTSVSRRG